MYKEKVFKEHTYNEMIQQSWTELKECSVRSLTVNEYESEFKAYHSMISSDEYWASHMSGNCFNPERFKFDGLMFIAPFTYKGDTSLIVLEYDRFGNLGNMTIEAYTFSAKDDLRPGWSILTNNKDDDGIALDQDVDLLQEIKRLRSYWFAYRQEFLDAIAETISAGILVQRDEVKKILRRFMSVE